MKRVLRRADAQRDPNLAWNEFVKLIARSGFEELDPSQHFAYLAFRYDSDVQNGGHLQYFENQPDELVNATIRALVELGASSHAQLLKRARARWTQREHDKSRTLEAYVTESLKMEFEDLDATYYDLRPNVTELLERHLESNRGLFLEFVD
jgi:hypothetical protein